MTTQLILEELKKKSFPILSADPEKTADDLSFLDNLLSQKTIVGLGEATYGAREIIQLKHRITRYLIENLGFRTIAIEANFSDCLPINEFLRTGEGDPEELLYNTHYWVWDTEEILELILWLREFNQSRPDDDQVQFYGFDIQGSSSAVKNIQSALENIIPDDVESLISPLLSLYTNANTPSENWERWRSFSSAEVQEIMNATEQLIGYIQANSSKLWPKNHRYEAFCVHQQAIHLKQLLTMLWTYTNEEYLFQPKFGVREQALASNITWQIERGKHKQKFVIWTHNAHVSRHTYIGQHTLGKFLTERFSDDYFSIGTCFLEGAFQSRFVDHDKAESVLYTPVTEISVDATDKDKVASLLSEMKQDMCLLDLQGFTQEHSAFEWLSEPQNMRISGATFSPNSSFMEIIPKDSFDALVYIKELTRARPLARTRDRFNIEKNW